MIPIWSPDVEMRVRAEAAPMDRQLAEAPKEIRFCTRCVVSNQRPRIVFDAEGVCSACRYAERKRDGRIDWEARGKELRALLDRHRRSTGYDVIVPVSGGKDSATIAHRLKHEFGMHPLCVTWAPFAYTEVGRANFEAFVHCGFDTIVAHPDGLMHRRLARLALEYLGDAWQPFAYGQLNFAMHAAVRFGVPLVMFGENGEAEYGGDPAANDKPCWDRADWDRVYLKGAGVDNLLDLGRALGAFEQGDCRSLSAFYAAPARAETEFHWWAHYNRWHPQANFYYAQANTGFTANPEGRSEGTYSKYASLDDKHDGFHYYMAYIKFGIGRCTSDAAHEVRDSEITRDEAVALVKRFDGEFPKRHFKEFCEYLGIDAAHFWRIVDRWRRSEIWELKAKWPLLPTDTASHEWKLRRAVWHTEPEARAA